MNIFVIQHLNGNLNLFQGYFNNVSEYLRIGPPLYFVVKNYNYRYKKFTGLFIFLFLLLETVELSLFYSELNSYQFLFVSVHVYVDLFSYCKEVNNGHLPKALLEL